MGNPNPNTDGLRPPYEKGKSGNPLGINAGRKPKAYRILNEILGKKKRAKEPKLTEALYDDVFLELYNLSVTELTEVMKHAETPSYMIHIGMIIQRNSKLGKMDLCRYIKKDIFGKEKNTGNGQFIIELGFDLGDKYAPRDVPQTIEAKPEEPIEESAIIEDPATEETENPIIEPTENTTEE